MGVISLPVALADGTVPTAANFMADFNVVVNEFNGNIDNANIKAGAAINESKIAFDATNGHGHTGGSDGKLIAVNRGFGFAIFGTLAVQDDVSWNPISPEDLTAKKIWAYIRTAPTGANLVAQVYNITQSKIVATITIVAGQTIASNETIDNDAIAAGDILRLDVTQVGSTVAGANMSVVLEATQP